jgi:hypothetical protein
VVALADVFRRFAGDYLSAHGASVLPSHRRAIADILACRTHALGGHLWRCNRCSYSYHSCKNRSCPRCHKDQTERWIAARKAELLPCPYFHVTVTVPAELRETLRAHQRDGYLARYVFRVAITEARIVGLDDTGGRLADAQATGIHQSKGRPMDWIAHFREDGTNLVVGEYGRQALLARRAYAFFWENSGQSRSSVRA